MQLNCLVPEMIVTNLSKSYYFWVEIIGFSLKYQRIEDKFMYLELNGVQFMLEEYQEDRWVTAKLDYPFGRGINFQIEVKEIDNILIRLQKENWPIFSKLRECWYRQNNTEHGQFELLVKDPDGYLLRIIQVIGDRSIVKI